jgi:hypothetical protein
LDSRLSADNWCPAARSSCGSAARGSKPGLNVGRGKDDTLFAKITGRIKFVDKGSMGKFVMVEPEAIEAK